MDMFYILSYYYNNPIKKYKKQILFKLYPRTVGRVRL